MDWAAALDFKQALVNCHNEMIGDWYRDPWGWPELDWTVKKRQDLLVNRLNRPGARRVAKVDVPKENFTIRPAVVLDPIDRLIYQALVGAVSRQLIGELDSCVFGWRLPLINPRPGKYSPNNHQWASYRFHLQQLASIYAAALKTDIVSFFASISVDRVQDAIQERGGSSRITERLVSMLDDWSRIPQRSGLPQRSFASSVLANMLLINVDDVLRHHAVVAPKRLFAPVVPASFARWMDDMLLFGNDAGDLRKAQLDIQSSLRELGLQLNTGKTKLLEGDEVQADVLNAEHSAVDSGLRVDPADVEPLEALIDRIIEDKESASRTSIKFATHRMRSHRQFGKVDSLLNVAHRLPHGSDALARLFRDSGRWRELEDWYLSYCDSSWGSVEWAQAQLATMFPSSERASGALTEYFANSLDRKILSLPMTAIVAQRLASWNDKTARAVISEAINRAENPLQRRVLALAALQAGHSRSLVRGWLNEFEENRVTLEMLEATHFRAPSLKPDFEG